MNLKEEFEKSELSYKALGEKVGIDSTSAWHCINNPWRTSWQTFRKVAEKLGINQVDARTIWRESKIKKGIKRVTDKYADL